MANLLLMQSLVLAAVDSLDGLPITTSLLEYGSGSSLVDNNLTSFVKLQYEVASLDGGPEVDISHLQIQLDGKLIKTMLVFLYELGNTENFNIKIGSENCTVHSANTLYAHVTETGWYPYTNGLSGTYLCFS